MQRSFESNVSLVHFLTLAALVWMSTRRDLSKPVVPLLVALTLIASYKESYLCISLSCRVNFPSHAHTYCSY